METTDTASFQKQFSACFQNTPSSGTIIPQLLDNEKGEGKRKRKDVRLDTEGYCKNTLMEPHKETDLWKERKEL